MAEFTEDSQNEFESPTTKEPSVFEALNFTVSYVEVRNILEDKIPNEPNVWLDCVDA